MTVKLIISNLYSSISPTPPPILALFYTSPPAPHYPPPIITWIKILLININSELLHIVGGYSSKNISIVTVAKAASEYLRLGNLLYKKKGSDSP